MHGPTASPRMEILLVPWFAQQELFQSALDLLDEDSRTRVLRFRRQEDAWRGLLGRHLILQMLREHGLGGELNIERTERGKPYIAEPHIDPPILFNLAHDNGLISLAHSRHPGERINGLGVDCMRLKLRSDETPSAFVDIISSVLTASEIAALKKSFPPDRQIERTFIIWTLKEAYIKAIGEGMAFDLPRMDCRLDDGVVWIGGALASEWEFRLFAVEIEETGKPKERYAVASAELVGAAEGHGRVVFESAHSAPCRIIPSNVLLNNLGLAPSDNARDIKVTVGRLFW